MICIKYNKILSIYYPNTNKEEFMHIRTYFCLSAGFCQTLEQLSYSTLRWLDFGSKEQSLQTSKKLFLLIFLKLNLLLQWNFKR